MKKHFERFTCPICKIEQHDVVISQTHLFSDPKDRTAFFNCNSCGGILLDHEVGAFAAKYRHRRRFIGGNIFWISVGLLIGCWLF